MLSQPARAGLGRGQQPSVARTTIVLGPRTPVSVAQGHKYVVQSFVEPRLGRQTLGGGRVSFAPTRSRLYTKIRTTEPKGSADSVYGA